MSVLTKDHQVTIIEKLLFLLEPHRYKVAWGGRGGVKSWTFARALLMLGAQNPLRILCTREIQKSIKDSVHKLLSDQIELMDLSDFYTVLENEIRGQNGTSIVFSGLADQTVTSIKSFERINICWIEEAQTVNKRSWSILAPTIRAPGSEIWVSFNPDLDTDDTYVRFVESPPPGAVVVHTTYRDNPWFTRELEMERAHDEQVLSKDEYAHVWEGQCNAAATGAIFANEVSEMVLSGRLTNLPYDPKMKVHAVLDMGWNDQLSLGCWQRGLADVRIINYHEYQFTRVDEVAGEMRKIPYNWGKVFLPWDAFITARQTGLTDSDVFRSFGFQVVKIPNALDAEQTRIRALRQLFPRIYVDQTKCVRLVECWKRYKRNIPKHGEPSTPVHDEYSHGCDMSGYGALVVEQMTNDNPGDTQYRPVVQTVYDAGLGALG